MHKHPDYNGFVSTVLPRRVTFGKWVTDTFCSTTDVYLNNHKVGSITLQKLMEPARGTKYYLFNDCGSNYSAYNLSELLPFIGYSSEAAEF